MYFHIRFQSALKMHKRPIFFPKGFYCTRKPVKFRWKHFSGDANVKVQAYDLKDELILRKDTPLIRIHGHGSL